MGSTKVWVGMAYRRALHPESSPSRSIIERRTARCRGSNAKLIFRRALTAHFTYFERLGLLARRAINGIDRPSMRLIPVF
jgi:hypothetical protein